MQFYGAVTEEPNFSIVTGKSHATHLVTNLYTYSPGMFFCPGIQSKHDVCMVNIMFGCIRNIAMC